jgi:hypothetical protein
VPPLSQEEERVVRRVTVFAVVQARALQSFAAGHNVTLR